jgi:hypothetical protein
VNDVVFGQFAEKFVGESINDGLKCLAGAATVFGLYTQNGVEYVASYATLIATNRTTKARCNQSRIIIIVSLYLQARRARLN